MKKIYLTCGLAIFLGIAGGIAFFLIRDANASVPSNITLTNQNSESYNFGKDKTKLKLIEFIYTHCPDICPTTTQKMTALKKDLVQAGIFRKKIEFITISIDPVRDTPEILTKYMKGFGISNNSQWTFLTGDSSTLKSDVKKIHEIANGLGFQFIDPGNGQFVHTTFTYLVDDHNRFIAKFPMGNNFNKQDVYESISKI
ncbi:SCO family protein [Bacillus sp. BRMEA1]|uniref:SCO family protein n=1 Tax=Neobacillus endophyticus TaxID=2738405 RepID=UPI0015661C68|nr:SCO family protein [Neobacillus endophyticus]NRD80417.1 SCO family protein [Neobacillus endophyticus]